MALASMIAWVYAAFILGEGFFGLIVAGFVGVIVFLTVWVISVSLITWDQAWREHAKLILKWHPSGRGRENFSVALRMALLMTSLWITAPYLGQVAFHEDIQRYVAAEATGALDAGRTTLADNYDSLIVAKEMEVTEKRGEYEREVSGKGASGLKGLGPIAEALRQDVLELQSERDGLIRQRQDALATFDQLASSWELNRKRLADEYNVIILPSGILQNQKAVEFLRTLPENRNTERAITAFLAFIFFGILVLKLFEPASVRLYFSDVLQHQYEKYLAGAYDPLLPVAERSTNQWSEMSPLRFYQFLIRVESSETKE